MKIQGFQATVLGWGYQPENFSLNGNFEIERVNPYAQTGELPTYKFISSKIYAGQGNVVEIGATGGFLLIFGASIKIEW